MGKGTTQAQSIEFVQPVIPPGVPGPAAQYLAQQQVTLYQLVRQIKAQLALLQTNINNVVISQFPKFANGRFWVDANGVVWLQWKDDGLGTYRTSYLHDGVWVVAQEQDT